MQIKPSHIACGVLLATTAGLVLAGQGAGGGDEFAEVWTTLTEWTQGTLGRIIAIAMVLVGVVAGVTRNSIMGLVVGVAAGMGLYNAPDVIDAIMGATVVASAHADALVHLVNGLA